MRIGIDLDGTVADLQRALAREAARQFHAVDPQTLPQSPKGSGSISTQPAPEQAFELSALSAEEQRQVWDAVLARHNFWESLAEIEAGAVARLSALARRHRWEVIFLTSRPESAGDTAQVQSHRWLTRAGFELPSVFVVHSSRGRIASALALDLVIDDRIENCVSVALDSGARPVLVWRGQPDGAPSNPSELGIGVVDTFGACLDLLEQMQADGDSVGLLDRIRLLFGRSAAGRGRNGGRR